MPLELDVLQLGILHQPLFIRQQVWYMFFIVNPYCYAGLKNGTYYVMHLSVGLSIRM